MINHPKNKCCTLWGLPTQRLCICKPQNIVITRYYSMRRWCWYHAMQVDWEAREASERVSHRDVSLPDHWCRVPCWLAECRVQRSVTEHTVRSVLPSSLFHNNKHIEIRTLPLSNEHKAVQLTAKCTMCAGALSQYYSTSNQIIRHSNELNMSHATDKCILIAKTLYFGQ